MLQFSFQREKYSSGGKKLSEISFRIVSFRALFYFAISRTRFRASCIIKYSCGARTHEILYEISFGILRDLVRIFAC